jgi:hypothetical protein
VNTNMALGPLVGSSARRLVRPSARPPVRFAAEPSLDMPRMLIPMRLCTVSMISFHSFEPSLPNAFACRYKYSLDTPSSMTNTGLIRAQGRSSMLPEPSPAMSSAPTLPYWNTPLSTLRITPTRSSQRIATHVFPSKPLPDNMSTSSSVILNVVALAFYSTSASNTPHLLPQHNRRR